MSDSNWYTGHESSAKAQHIHSINIHGYNTWDDWHLIPSSRPVVNPPTKKRSTINNIGGNGIIDESDSLRGFSLYNTRQGSWEFYVENDYGDWQARYTEIMDAIHGIQCTVSLDDDPSWYYTGTVSINEWKSNKDRSVITLDYDLYPYKLSFPLSTNEDWLWDPFNFETDWIYSKPGYGLNKISIDSSDDWVQIQYSDGYFGRQTISPKIILSDVTSDIYVKLNNPELNILPTDFDNGNGIVARNNLRIAGFVLSTINKNNINTIYLKGVGTISFEFRVGRF